MLNLADADELVGRMTAGRVAWAQFEGEEGHQGLIAQCGTSKGLHAHLETALDERVALRDA